MSRPDGTAEKLAASDPVTPVVKSPALVPLTVPTSVPAPSPLGGSHTSPSTPLARYSPFSSPKQPFFSNPSFPSRRLERLGSLGSALHLGEALKSPNIETPTSNVPEADLPPPNLRDLLKLAAGVVKNRNGSVLSRGFIIKSDYRLVGAPSPSDSSSPGTHVGGGGDLDSLGGLHLRGASNFRAAELGVHGVAQPSETGIRTILSVLRSQPVLQSGGQVAKGRQTVWFCTREEPVLFIGEQPFVLRDAASPTKTYALSDRAENLEEIEQRFKHDVIKEAARYGGLILVQEEVGEREIRNTWVTADSVRTIRDVFDDVRASGYNVTYHRVPVTRDQSPEDRYLDRYTALLATIPTSASLVFNCGVGVVRTTFAMCAALVIRRQQLMAEGAEDPYGLADENTRLPQDAPAAIVLRAQSEQATRDQSLLRLMTVLQKSLATRGQHLMLSLLSSQPKLLENLRTALLGNYDLVLSLLSTLDDGHVQKRLVDTIVDHCDVLVNLRESVLEHRVRYASSALLDEEASRDHRAKALAALERYFFLISFASYAQESAPTFDVKFSYWLRNRSEIAKMISRLRKSGGGHFFVFSPVNDLSSIARGEAGELAAVSSLGKKRFDEVHRTGGEVVGDEWASQIVRSRGGIILRSGMILKNDQWREEEEGQTSTIRGAVNFRRVPKSSLYGLSQPTQEGIERVLEEVMRSHQGEDARVVWMNLREEPLLYINGTPFVLRQEAVSLRNVRSYAGISSTRLELLESRLKADVLAELKSFDGRLLLHSETTDGCVTPAWEAIEDESNIKTLREIMDGISAKMELGGGFEYRRIPITAEKSPDFNDVKDIVEVVAQLDVDRSVIIVNCQLGRGRSTRAQVLITLVQRWLRAGFRLPTTDSPRSTRYSYTVIQNLLRTIRAGQEVKNAVDEAITLCGETFDLLEAIEDSRQAAEDAKIAGDVAREKDRTQRGILNLRRVRSYFFLILFSSFLLESKAETWRELREHSSYEAFVRERPVFKTIERELDAADLNALVPLEKPLAPGIANQDEIRDFVAKRTGRILSAYTLLKSDYFSGLQKMSLPERVEGAPNFRRVKLLFGAEVQGTLTGADTGDSSPLVYGSGMPTIDGLRRALDRMGAKNKLIVWTSMREEPVVFVSGGRPHVLRLFDAPLENVVTTGVTTDIVESMERSLKSDLLREASENEGKILLHDEIEEPDGSFTVTATWEDIGEDAIRTPAEVFKTMRGEGFNVDYARLPVTDEQAPIPAIFARIEERVSAGLAGQKGDNVGFVFNCQMGRGRTTTGMVAAALVTNILHNTDAIFDLSSSAIEHEDVPNMAWDGREVDPLLQGEYKLILQIVSLTQFGKLAKNLTDRAIDSMEGVQNLRKAVYDFKLRVEACQDGSKKHHKLFEQALNYLYRYAALIIFANYLLEKAALSYEDDDEAEGGVNGEKQQRRLQPFPAWLEERRELKHLLRTKVLD